MPVTTPRCMSWATGPTSAWAGSGIGLATAFVATGLGGIRSSVLPKWFADPHRRARRARCPRRRGDPARRSRQLPAAALLADRRLGRRREEFRALRRTEASRAGHLLAGSTYHHHEDDRSCGPASSSARQRATRGCARSQNDTQRPPPRRGRVRHRNLDRGQQLDGDTRSVIKDLLGTPSASRPGLRSGGGERSPAAEPERPGIPRRTRPRSGCRWCGHRGREGARQEPGDRRR